MTNIITKTALGAALAATALVSATPASAHDYYDHDRGGDTAGAAIVGGVIGLALGAIIASNGNHHRDRYDRRYYNRGYNGSGYYNQGYNGYYNNNGYNNNNGYYNNGYNNAYRGYDNDRRGYDNDRGDYRRGY